MSPRVKKVLLVAIAGAAVAFAVQGGEYGTRDLLDQRARKRRLLREIDSLRAYHRRLQTDPELQERIAREEFGMVRGEKEILYRFADGTGDGDGTR